MQLFPVFLDLSERRCLVVGGGAVGCDKARRLAAAGAEVLVIDPLPPPPLVELAAATSRVGVERRRFRDDDCSGRLLVFACTDDPAVNAAVAAAARARGALCDRADSAGQSDFSTAATLRRGSLCVAVSSGGASPALAAAARDRIASVVGDEFAVAATMLAGLRERLKDSVAEGAARGEALRAAISGGLLEALRDGRREQAEALLEDVFNLHPATPDGNPCTR